MTEELLPENEDERLKAENDFLKMKLMLEQGAEFPEKEDILPPEIENIFLNNIIAFEQQFRQQKPIKIFDKIGRPTRFKPVSEIPDEEIEKAWTELQNYLNRYSLVLDVCSPNISFRELYRFAIEELFEHEITDVDLPGWTHTFIYDEFHPDPVYDTTRAATEDCIACILRKEPLEYTFHFSDDNLRLNGHSSLTLEELKTIINKFKLAYDDVEIKEIIVKECTVNDTESIVAGTYAILATVAPERLPINGDWKVMFHLENEFNLWRITEIDIEGIAF